MAVSTTAWSFSYQRFPASGVLSGNLNLDRNSLIQRIGGMRGDVYCYIVKTVESAGRRFVQTGSAPNFQGGLITLCTCKWRMRAGRDVDAWRGVWIAGITGAPAGDHGRGHLFFLMRVEQSFASHLDLWTWLAEHAPEAAEVKAADTHRLGDVYRPALPYGDPYDPRAYVAPRTDHVHGGQVWHKDVDFHAFGRRPALLVGDSKNSFLWSKPSVPVPFQVGRGCKRVTLDEMLAESREANTR